MGDSTAGIIGSLPKELSRASVETLGLNLAP